MIVNTILELSMNGVEYVAHVSVHIDNEDFVERFWTIYSNGQKIKVANLPDGVYNILELMCDNAVVDGEVTT